MAIFQPPVGPANALKVGPAYALTSIGNRLEGIDGNAAQLDTPVGERHECFPVRVASPGRYFIESPLVQEPLESRSVEIGESAEAASRQDDIEDPARLPDMPAACPFRFQAPDVGLDVFGDRRRQVLGRPGFRRGDQSGADPLGLTLQIGEH